MAYEAWLLCASILLCLEIHAILGQNCPPAPACNCLGRNILCSKIKQPIPWNKLPDWIENLIIEHVPTLRVIKVSDVPYLPRLKHLNISRSSLKTIEFGVLDKLPVLTTLLISWSQLREIPNFGRHDRLQKLILNNNQISNWSSEALSSLSALQVLNLNNNNIARLEANSFSINSPLRQLYVQKNGLRYIAPTLGTQRLTGLEVLKLQSNKLQLSLLDRNGKWQHILPPFPSVKHLDLSRNTAVIVGSLLFANWTSLRSLKLRRCDIELIGPGAFVSQLQDYQHQSINEEKSIELDGLRELDLSGNSKLRSVEASWLFGLSQLRRLLLVKCGLHRLAAGTFEALLQLRELDLSENDQLHVLGSGRGGAAVLVGLARLEILKVNRAGLVRLETSGLAGLENLRRLELRDNRLNLLDTHVDDGVLEPLKQLLYLDLRDNAITRLRGASLRGAQRLYTLDLRGNAVETMDNMVLGALGNMFQLRSVRLDSISLDCSSCLWRKFASWLVDRKLKNGVLAANCSSGQRLLQLVSLQRPAAADNLQQDSACQLVFGPQLVTQPIPSNPLLLHANLTLQCVFSSAEKPILWWEYSSLHRNDNEEDVRLFKRVEPDNIRSFILQHTQSSTSLEVGAVTRYTLHLQVFAVTLDDSGRYRCLAKNAHGQLASLSAEVRVYVLPTFINQPLAHMVVQAGTTVEIPCAATGIPQPQTSLRKADGSRFVAAKERRIQVMRGDRSFFIAAVSGSDAGAYVCQSENTAGKIHSNFTLIVHEPPRFRGDGPPQQLRVRLNMTAKLSCLADSLQPPAVEWTRDGQALKSNATEYTLHTNDQELLFKSVVAADAGFYRCRLSNAVAAVEAVIELVVSDAADADIDKLGVGSSPLTWTMSFVLVISVVTCVLTTSFVWLVALYFVRRRRSSRKRKSLAEQLFSREQNLQNCGSIVGMPNATAISEDEPYLQYKPVSKRPLLLMTDAAALQKQHCRCNGDAVDTVDLDAMDNCRHFLLGVTKCTGLQRQPFLPSSTSLLLKPPLPPPRSTSFSQHLQEQQLRLSNHSSEPSLGLTLPQLSSFCGGLTTSDYHTASSRSDSGSDSYQQSSAMFVSGIDYSILEERHPFSCGDDTKFVHYRVDGVDCI